MGDLLGSPRVAPHFLIFGLFYSYFALAAICSIPPRVYFLLVHASVDWRIPPVFGARPELGGSFEP